MKIKNIFLYVLVCSFLICIDTPVCIFANDYEYKDNYNRQVDLFNQALNGDDQALLAIIQEGGRSTSEIIPEQLVKLLLDDFDRTTKVIDSVVAKDETLREVMFEMLKLGVANYPFYNQKTELINFYRKHRTFLKNNIYFDSLFNEITLGNCISSSILNNGEMVYGAWNIYDENLNTAWVEGVKGSGINEWIAIYLQSFESERNVISKIKITNGYAKSKELYEANNRVKTIQIELSDGQKRIVELKDTMEPQIVIFDRSIIQSVKLTILDVYKGSRYDDMCISEVEFL